MALNAPYTPNTTIQSTQVSNDLTGLANGTNDTTNNSMATFRSDIIFDHVISGCVWSGDAYASTRNASQTAGVVYIAGVRLAVASVSARLYTASKDTYIDLNGSGVQVYTEVTNNAASPALAAGSIRIGIIITGATTIANSGSVNQGQETLILPIASSIPYQVTDSLGNLICSRDPDRMLLGQRTILSSASGSPATITQITGLSVPIIIPTARKIKIYCSAESIIDATAGRTIDTSIWDGVVSSGTQLRKRQQAVVGAAATNPFDLVTHAMTLAAGSHTINLGWTDNASGALTLSASATSPAMIRIELA